MGLLLLLPSLAAIAFGAFMAMDPKHREAGRFFAVWWVPGAAAASGVLMRDIVTFTVGSLCFLVAGAAFALGSGTYGTRHLGGDQEEHGNLLAPARGLSILVEESGAENARATDRAAGRGGKELVRWGSSALYSH